MALLTPLHAHPPGPAADSPDLFRQVFERADVGIGIANLDGYLQHCNAALLELLGYSLEEVRSRPVMEFSHPADEGNSRSLFEEMKSGARERYRVEKRYRRKDGTVLWAELSVQLMRDEQGRPRGAVGIVQDISERRQAERNRAQLAAIVESSQDAIIAKTLDGVVTSWNAAAERLFGYAASEMTATPIFRMIPPELHAEEHMLLERLRRGERVESYETVRRHKDGRPIEVSLTISPLRDSAGRVIGASTIARDISAARAAERVLRESEARYRSLVEASGAIVFHSDGEARWRSSQPAWEAYTGQSFEQYRDFGWLEAVHPDDREHVFARARDAIARGVMFEVEARVWHDQSRTWRHQEARAVPIRDAGGTVREWVGTCVDVHPRKEAEEALRLAGQRKDEFLATLAHELRNPMAPIANTLEILHTEGVDPAAARELTAIARRQLRHLVRLVDDLMEVSRITRGAIELRREPTLLTMAVQSAVEIAEPLIRERGHQLTVSLPPHQLLVHGDRTRLTQVVANLLNNAAKYTAPGGRITITGSRDGGWALLRVKDNGAGIPADMLTRIFDMFTQVDRTLERSQGGLGIGLSLVRRLVELHGGTVEARSEGLNRGSEFIVRLPLALALEPGRREAANGPLTPALPRRRVLIADDNLDAARILALLLQTLGQEVHLAHDGEEALERIRALRPEIVLMDLGMPRLTGYEVAERIRQEPWGAQMKLVALTGWGQDEDRRRTREAGFDRHLVKPVNGQTLQEILAS